jgi:hypothetical protein
MILKHINPPMISEVPHFTLLRVKSDVEPVIERLCRMCIHTICIIDINRFRDFPTSYQLRISLIWAVLDSSELSTDIGSEFRNPIGFTKSQVESVQLDRIADWSGVSLMWLCIHKIVAAKRDTDGMVCFLDLGRYPSKFDSTFLWTASFFETPDLALFKCNGATSRSAPLP